MWPYLFLLSVHDDTDPLPLLLTQNAIIFEDPVNGTTHRYEEYLPDIKGYKSARAPSKGFTTGNDDDDDEHACTFTWQKESPFAQQREGSPSSGSGSATSPVSDAHAPSFHSHGSLSPRNEEAAPGTGEDDDDDNTDAESDDEEGEGEIVMEDHVDHASSGVQDIIVAGEVSPPTFLPTLYLA